MAGPLLAVALIGAAPAPGGALGDAVRAGDIAAATRALAGHADPNGPLAFGATPLAWAAEAGDEDMAALLLAHGADPSIADDTGTTPLALACEHDAGGLVARLIAAGAKPAAGSLAICAAHAPADAVARLLAAGAPADAVDARGQTPLMWAAAAGRTEAVALLLKAGADPNRASPGRMTPLLFAIKSGVPATADALIAAGALTDVRGPEDASALQVALYQRNFAVAETLVSRAGVDLAARDRNGNQPLHVAAAAGALPLVRLMLSRGADPNALTGPSRVRYVTESNFGVPPPVPPPMPPLFAAAIGGQVDAMRILSAAGANARFVAVDGTTLPLAAASGQTAEALAFALAMPGADANAADAKGMTALHVVVRGGELKPDTAAMLRMLAAHGARADLKSTKGKTARDLIADGPGDLKAAFAAAFPRCRSRPPGGAERTSSSPLAGARRP